MARPENITTLLAEHPNLRAALTWLDGAGAANALLKLTTGLGYFWYLTVHEPEGLAWLQRALARYGDKTTPEYVEALVRAGHLAHTLGDSSAAGYLTEARALARASRDDRQEAHAIVLLGMMAEDGGDYARAQELLSTFRTLAQQAHFLWGRTLADYHLGVVAYGQGDIERARTTLEAARAAAQSIDDALIPIWSRAYLALIACEQDRLGHAADLLREDIAAEVWASVERKPTLFGTSAVLAVALGEYASAARLLGAAAVAHHEVPFPFPERDAFARAAEVATQQMGADAYAAGRAAGRLMPIEAIRAEIVRLAILAESTRLADPMAG